MNFSSQFQCNACPRSFAYKRGLTEHIQAKHGKFISRYGCFKCATTFVNKTLWVKHLEDAHQTVVSLEAAKDNVQKIRNTQKCKFLCSFDSFTLSSIISIASSYLLSFAVAEQRSQKMKKIVRPKLTCDVTVNGKVCGIVTHESYNMKRHKRDQHSLVE